jgi:plastocyanin
MRLILRYSLLMVTLLLALAMASCGSGSSNNGGGDYAPPGGSPAASPTATAETTATGTSTAAATASVMMKNIKFDPDSLTVAAGTTVTWTNEDSVAHTVTSDDGLFDSGNINKGDTFSYTFDKPGTYDYHCTLHPPNMIGTVVVQ